MINTDKCDKCDICLVSIYIAPKTSITNEQWKKLLRNIPRPCIIAGDFNAHHFAWRCEYCDEKEHNLLKAIENDGLHLLNDGQLL